MEFLSALSLPNFNKHKHVNSRKQTPFKSLFAYSPTTKNICWKEQDAVHFKRLAYTQHIRFSAGRVIPGRKQVRRSPSVHKAS
jgi:hypothetical protein